MYHLKLQRSLSYCNANGTIKATRQNPDIYIEDRATADAAVASGFFALIGEEDAPAFPPPGEIMGHLDRKLLESMTVPDLKKLAGDMGVDIKGIKDKAAIIEAIAAVEVSAPAFDAEELAAMSDAELEALVKEKGIDLTGCQTREDALEAISVALGGSYTMLDLMRE